MSEKSIHVLAVSQDLRNGFYDIPVNRKDLYNIEMMFVDDDNSFNVECDVVFIGMDDFLIYATEDGRFYSRPCFNNPARSMDSVCRINRSADDIKPACLYGSYFDSFESALDTSIAWLGIDPTRLPKCQAPPIVKSIEK